MGAPLLNGRGLALPNAPPRLQWGINTPALCRNASSPCFLGWVTSPAWPPSQSCSPPLVQGVGCIDSQLSASKRVRCLPHPQSSQPCLTSPKNAVPPPGGFPPPGMIRPPPGMPPPGFPPGALCFQPCACIALAGRWRAFQNAAGGGRRRGACASHTRAPPSPLSPSPLPHPNVQQTCQKRQWQAIGGIRGRVGDEKGSLVEGLDIPDATLHKFAN